MPIGIQLLAQWIKTKTGHGMLLHFNTHTFLLVNDKGAVMDLTEAQVTQVAEDVVQHIADHITEIKPEECALVNNRVGHA
jgi:hypothetical protein